LTQLPSSSSNVSATVSSGAVASAIALAHIPLVAIHARRHGDIGDDERMRLATPMELG